MNLWKMDVPITVYTLYGELTKWLSPEMASVSKRMKRLGIPFLKNLPRDLLYWKKRSPEVTKWLFRTIPGTPARQRAARGLLAFLFLLGVTTFGKSVP